MDRPLLSSTLLTTLGYVESLNDPTNDPLNLWMTGGPGCSGLIGKLHRPSD